MDAVRSRPEHAAGRRGTRRLAVLLAWVAGAVDAIGYLALAHLFTAHMSGNSVAFGAAIATGEAGEALRRGATVVLFAFGIGIGSALGEIRRERGRRHPTVAVFGAEAALLVAFLVLGKREPMPAPDEPRFYLMVALLTLAMGLQSATLRRVGHMHVRTTYISGVLTSLVEAIVHHVLRVGGDTGTRVRVYAAIWGVYLFGAIVGGLGYTQGGSLGTGVPLAGLAVAIGLDLRHPHDLANVSTSEG